MKNKVIVWVLVYSAVSIAFKLYVFYSGNQGTKLGDLSHLITLLFILPFIGLAVYQKRKANNGLIAGREAVREGMHFTLLSIVILGLFNYVFYELEMGKYIVSTISNVDYNELLIQAKRHDKNITMEKVVENQKAYIASFTAFRDTTFKIFGYLLFGAFSSFVCGVTFKKG